MGVCWPLGSPMSEGAAANQDAGDGDAGDGDSGDGDAVVTLSVAAVLWLPINSPLHLSLHF